MNRIARSVILLTVFFLCGCKSAEEPTISLFENLGSHHHPITTNSELAQRYFDQGLILAYAFNHDAAAQSFREAVRLDPDCAMCYWGIALSLGPTINTPMSDEAVPEAYESVQKALKLAENASAEEKAYIRALEKRYLPEPVEDRTQLDIAYADAMREVSKQYPDDTDAAALFAEALMDLHPWNYWTIDGSPQPWTPEILKVLESALAKDLNHPLANHLYIHAVEASPDPGRAEANADRLAGLVPGSGHIVHMPSHIYIRIGRYLDASLANEKAIEVDNKYVSLRHIHGVYTLAYVPHNHHFLWATTTMEGRSEYAIRKARDVASMADPEKMREPGYGILQHFFSLPLYSLVRFGKWDEILKEPRPAEDLIYPNGVWHYARGMAYARKGELEKAEKELEKLKAKAADPSLEQVTLFDLNSTASILKIATEVLAGELAAERGEYKKAIGHLKTAVRLEDGLTFDEPPPWYHGVRQSLGAVLMDAGRVEEAKKFYREDLVRNPENGWSLFGLHKSLLAQGKVKEAEEVKKRFDKAWKRADVTLTASRF
jgi:tetratricopeptide (TPR) repeat protein